MITGDPETVEAAARALGTAGTTLDETGETVGNRASTLDASWSGAASGAATRAVGELAQRIGAGGPPCSSVDDALIAYAQALRDAQRERAAASADAEAGATALENANAAAATARATPPTIDQEIGSTGVDTASAALTRAAGAEQDARNSIAAARSAMADAVARLAQANQAAADAVSTATEQLSGMEGTGARAGGPAEATKEGRARRADDARAETAQDDPVSDTVKNVAGGLGDGAWKIAPGAIGWAGGLIPGKVGDAIEGTVQGWHDDLEDWYGADTDSVACRGTSGAVQVASLAIPGMGVVKAGRVIGAARDARTIGVAMTAKNTAAAARSAVVDGVRTARVLGRGAVSTTSAAAGAVRGAGAEVARRGAQGVRDLFPVRAEVTAAEDVGGTALRGSTGGRTADEWRGLFSRLEDPEDVKAYLLRESYASERYSAVRDGTEPLDAAAIARSPDLEEAEVRQVLDHVFVEEHLLEDRYSGAGTVVARFDPNADRIDAFRRLESGGAHPADHVLIRHELIESGHMRADPTLTYEKAHDMTTEQGWDWTAPPWEQFCPPER